MTDYDPRAWILSAAEAGTLKRYDNGTSWSASREYLDPDETALSEQLLADGVLQLGPYDRLTDFPYWMVVLGSEVPR